MSDRIYISSHYSQVHITWITAKLARAGFEPNGVCVWSSVAAFVATLEQGDRVVVHSLGTFDGSVELFGALRLIFQVGATLHSVREAELTAKLTWDQVEALYTASVDGLLGQSAEAFSRVDPSTVERLARMDRLIQGGVSVSEASRQSGCSRNVYYYYQRTRGVESTQAEELTKRVRPMASHKGADQWSRLTL